MVVMAQCIDQKGSIVPLSIASVDTASGGGSALLDGQTEKK